MVSYVERKNENLMRLLKQFIPIGIKTHIRYYIELLKMFGQLSRLPLWRLKYLSAQVYHADGFITLHDAPFLRNKAFIKAYDKSLDGLENFYIQPNSKFRQDYWESAYEIAWRAHIVSWAAMQVKNVPGDFIECGDSNGLLS